MGEQVMSIWGDADASKVSDNPFHVEPNWYPATSAECYEKELDVAEGKSQLIIKWKLDAPGTEYDKLPVTDRKTYWKPPAGTEDFEEWWNELDGDKKRSNSFLKMLLREGFDLKPDELNRFTPKDGLNKRAMVEVTNNPDKNNDQIIYNNVRSVLSRRLYEERYGEIGATNGQVDDMPATAYSDASMISDI
jgi:hypothetical protein